jgi:tetratricopeptide (TPR) repeat protein
MKKVIAIILVLLSTQVFSQESKFEQANRLYTSEQYQKAIGLYKEVIQQGYESAELYFNLGNAYFKTKDINNAILYYEKAHLLAPNDNDIAFNLKIANQFVVTSIEPLPQPFFVRWRNAITNLYTADTWAGISLFSFIFLLTFLGLYIFTRSANLKRVSFIFGIVLVVLVFVSFSFASKQKSEMNRHNKAIVFCPRVTVKSAPTETATDLFLIYEGLKVDVIDSLKNWKEVKLQDGNQGWLRDSCIVKI